ncbi:MAG TPA: isocitrate lyase/phosphoenolpyruvate mutase family protein [Candidatus Binataceae bacterium]|nr:isocitrate lyase/phosphoenolpyruvate mutase family protein [Candidatus Binataceae bacterium]
MTKDAQRAKAQAFRAMHDRSRVLVLPNAWDAMSARFIEEAGAHAIATTSAGVAFSLGYPDGEYAPREEIVNAIARITRVIDVPLSADIESGFGTTAGEVGQTVSQIIEAGAVGINLEDSTGDPAQPLYDLETAVTRVKAARAAGDATGVPLVINARTDALIAMKGEREALLAEAIRRANAFREAGADSLFPLGLNGNDEIARAVRSINGPMNLIFRPGIPTVAELAKLGVARLSLGTAITLSALSVTRRIANEVLTSGTYSALGDAVSYPEANKLMASRN